MTDEPLAFFTLDRGTATTSAALLGRLEGRFRLLAADAQPAGLPVEPLFEELVGRVAAVDPGLLPSRAGWPAWRRAESATHEPPTVLIAAAAERRLAALEAAFGGAGWQIAGRLSGEGGDVLAATRAALAPDLDLVVIAADDPIAADERRALPELAALLAAAVGRRPDLHVLLAGGAATAATRFSARQVLLGPAPVGEAAAALTPLHELARDLAERVVRQRVGEGGPPDGRRALRTAIASLAALLDRRVEAVDVGHAAGQRVLADAQGVSADLVRPEAALVPRPALEDDRAADAVLRWSTLRGDPYALRDRVRNLRLHPWRDAWGDGARLRLAAARAALVRLDEAWRPPGSAAPGLPGGGAVAPPADLLVASGGAFAVAPGPAVALALLDALRRPGGLALLLDHARVLAPIGGLAGESERRRLLADCFDGIFVPLGSVIVAAGVRAGRRAGSIRVADEDGSSDVELVPGAVQVVELAPGRTAVADLDARDGAWLGVRSRRLALEVSGGLAGLLIDAREVPLRLPDRPEPRRQLLDAWQRPLWPPEPAP